MEKPLNELGRWFGILLLGLAVLGAFVLLLRVVATA